MRNYYKLSGEAQGMTKLSHQLLTIEKESRNHVPCDGAGMSLLIGKLQLVLLVFILVKEPGSSPRVDILALPLA